MSIKTPAIGMSGIFTINAPFDVPDTISYTVEAHRTFNEIIHDGIDPVEYIYEPVGLTESDYVNDAVTPGALVIVLVSERGERVRVPNTYIVDYPNTSVVPHAWIVATVSLGVLPLDYDFQRVRDAIETSVSDFIGVESTVHIAMKRTHDVVTEERAEELASIRNAAITYRETDRADKLALQATVAQQKEQIDDLIKIIEDLQSTP